MIARRLPFGLFVLAVAALGLAGCEPYMGMTDQIPAQTRQATALLPETPRYVGMVDLETALKEVEAFTDVNVMDSLRQAESGFAREFLDATGMDPKTDLKAVYAAIGQESFSTVLFADLTPTQVDRYLDRTSEIRGRATTYRGVTVYHLAAEAEMLDEEPTPDTLSLAFVRSGMIALAMDTGQVEAMVDRHKEQNPSFRDNGAYMELVKRVGHGSTAWLVGRDVLQSALRDSAVGEGGPSTASSSGSRINGAGIQRVLSRWSDRVLGLSSATPSSFGGEAGRRIERLKRRVREQAVSVTLNGEALEGQVYLTMRDESSASNVVDIAKGALAALRLSKEKLDERHRDLLDEVNVERKGPIVHVRFAIDRGQLKEATQTARFRRSTRRSESATRLSKATIRRLGGITAVRPALSPLQIGDMPCNLFVDRPVHCTAASSEEGRASASG